MPIQPPPGYTGPTAPYNVLSEYGGIDPNFVSQNLAESVVQGGALPFGIGQYLQANNPVQLAQAINYSMGQAAPSALQSLISASSGQNLAPYQQNLNWLAGSAVQGLNPFLQGNVGDVGSSPTMQAALKAWQQNVQPQVQQQMQLAGLGRSAANASAQGESLTSALLPVLQNEFANRLSASGQIPGLTNAMTGWAGLGAQTQLQAGQSLGNLALQMAQMQQQGGQEAAKMLQQGGQFATSALQNQMGLEQQAALNAANIANQEQQRGIQAGQGAGEMLLNLSQPLLGMGQFFQQGQMNALGAAGQAGQVQRDIAQQAQDAAYQDYLRRQGLAETSSTGLFGGTTLPSALQTASKTESSK